MLLLATEENYVFGKSEQPVSFHLSHKRFWQVADYSPSNQSDSILCLFLK
jgi:hypothetical protein